MKKNSNNSSNSIKNETNLKEILALLSIFFSSIGMMALPSLVPVNPQSVYIPSVFAPPILLILSIVCYSKVRQGEGNNVEERIKQDDDTTEFNAKCNDRQMIRV